MRRKLIATGFVLILVLTVLAVMTSMTAGSGGGRGGYNQLGNTLIADEYDAVELDDTNTQVWYYRLLHTYYYAGTDVERLDNGNSLVCSNGYYSPGYVREVTQSGSIVWQYTNVWASDCDRLDNGNTLICLMNSGRIIEVNPAGSIVWQRSGMNWPADAERLDNGNTLICETGFYSHTGRIFEVNPAGAIVWQYTGRLYYPWDVERLDNGNTLIAGGWNYEVIEVTPANSVVWRYRTYTNPNGAKRLVDGNTLISETNSWRLREVDPSYATVWTWSSGLWYPHDAKRIEIRAIPADVRLEPQSLNLDSMGNWVQFKIFGFPENPEYTHYDVDITTVKVAGVDADLKFGTVNENKYIGKADRLMVEDAIGAPGQEVEVGVSGQVTDGTAFRGSAIIKAIQN
jgi:hypothetical protein